MFDLVERVWSTQTWDGADWDSKWPVLWFGPAATMDDPTGRTTSSLVESPLLDVASIMDQPGWWKAARDWLNDQSSGPVAMIATDELWSHVRSRGGPVALMLQDREVAIWVHCGAQTVKDESSASEIDWMSPLVRLDPEHELVALELDVSTVVGQGATIECVRMDADLRLLPDLEPYPRAVALRAILSRASDIVGTLKERGLGSSGATAVVARMFPSLAPVTNEISRARQLGEAAAIRRLRDSVLDQQAQLLQARHDSSEAASENELLKFEAQRLQQEREVVVADFRTLLSEQSAFLDSRGFGAMEGVWRLARGRATSHPLRGLQSFGLERLARAEDSFTPRGPGRPNIRKAVSASGPALARAVVTDECPGVFVQISPISWHTDLVQRPHHMAAAAARAGWLSRYCSWTLGEGSSEHHALDMEPLRGLRLVDFRAGLAAENHGLWYSTYSTDLSVGWQTLQALRDHGNFLIYEYVDEIDPEISPLAPELLQRHQEQVDPTTVDIVVVTAGALEDEMRHRFPDDQLIVVPNGVDAGHYQEWAEPTREGLLQLMPHLDKEQLVVGYFGALAPWLDWDQIRLVARSRPEVQFVFIGPRYDLTGRSIPPDDEPNIHELGPVPYERLGSVAAGFDAAWIPFRPGEIARTTNPLKLFEYFALKLPVLAPEYMVECASFDEVFTSSSVAGLGGRLAEAFSARGSSRYRDKATLLAMRSDWSERFAIIAEATRAFMAARLERTTSG